MDEWKNEVYSKIVRDVKKTLTSRPLLKLPDPRKKYYINVDAYIKKGRGLGATLSQENTTPPSDPNFIRRTNKHKEGLFFKVIKYWSRLLTDRERGYSATKCKALSLHDANLHWASLLSNGIPFTVDVDHLALVYLIAAPVTPGNRKIMTMILILQEFNFEIEYRKGGQHANADAISRLL
jgi:hypothetical protein